MDDFVGANPPIFIVGAARSGTTLLCRMLTAHSQIFIKNELPGLRQIFTETKTEQQIMAAISKEMETAYHMTLADFMRDNGKTVWGVKDPEFTYCLSLLEKCFVNARILFIIRDGRAVTNSNMKNKFGLCTNVYSGALRWKKDIEIQNQFIKKTSDRCLVVKYETLVVNAERELRKICDFINVPYNKSMVDYTKQKTLIKKTPQNINTFSALDSQISTKWQSELSPFQINVFEHVAGDTLTEYGYELIGEQIKLCKALKLWYRFHQMVLGELQIQYQWRIKNILKKLTLSHG